MSAWPARMSPVTLPFSPMMSVSEDEMSPLRRPFSMRVPLKEYRPSISESSSMKAVRPFLPMELRFRVHMSMETRAPTGPSRGAAGSIRASLPPPPPWRPVSGRPQGPRFALPEVDWLHDRTRLEGYSTARPCRVTGVVACKLCGCQRLPLGSPHARYLRAKQGRLLTLREPAKYDRK